MYENMSLLPIGPQNDVPITGRFNAEKVLLRKENRCISGTENFIDVTNDKKIQKSAKEFVHPKTGTVLCNLSRAMQLTGYSQTHIWHLSHELGRVRFLKISERRIWYYKTDLVNLINGI